MFNHLFEVFPRSHWATVRQGHTESATSVVGVSGTSVWGKPVGANILHGPNHCVYTLYVDYVITYRVWG